ncbi:MAG TPA: nucleoside-diphosphate kinase, partial [Actinomycetota bacterium]|nr:nucleoside-diphosphate kinase [Actinomycetota bacterium]
MAPKDAPENATGSTLLIVKPDGVRRHLIGEVLRRVEEAGLTIEDLRMETIDRATAEEHYGEHRDKPFFDELVE